MKNKCIALLGLFSILACNSDDDQINLTQTVSYTVQANYSENFDSLAAKDATITLQSTNTSEVYQMLTDANGQAVFGAVIPGTYDINATVTFSAEEFNQTFGYFPESEEVIFNASLGQTTISLENNQTQLVLNTARMGDLVIKQIYYGGSHTQQGASFRDQFIEIYNNSNEVIFADGLYFAFAYGVLNTTTTEYVQPNGQFDWSQSIGMTIGNSANTNYLYADYVYQIPGNGNQYPIEPGASIVIAQSALNHKSPLVDNTGEEISVLNPDLTIDLSDADFEANFIEFRAQQGLEPFRTDIENPSVPNVNISFAGRPGAYHAITDMLLDNLGRDSYVIFRADNLEFNTYALPNVREVTESTKMYMQIPADIVIDGVETQHASNNIPKRLPETLDISSTRISAPYTSKSVIRKTKTTVDGRRILQDTNNSSEDFVEIIANPRGFFN